MFDRLEDLLRRYEEIMNELNEPSVTANQDRFRSLMKEQSDLTPLVEAYKEYKKVKQDAEDSMIMLESESDEEMRELLKEENSEAKRRIQELEQEMKILLLPKDPNDDKNVVVEIRAGAGGDEAALFAAEMYRLYVKYAERNRWKVELVGADEIGIGGMKEVSFMINGKGAYSRLKLPDVSCRDAVIPTVCTRRLRRRSTYRLSGKAKRLRPLPSRTSLINTQRSAV